MAKVKKFMFGGAAKALGNAVRSNPAIASKLGAIGAKVLGGQTTAPSGLQNLRGAGLLGSPGPKQLPNDGVNQATARLGGLPPPSSSMAGAMLKDAQAKGMLGTKAGLGAAIGAQPGMASRLGTIGRNAMGGLGVKNLKMKKGGSVSSASKRADGCAIKGKTKGKMV